MNKQRLERYSLAGPENQAAVDAGGGRGLVPQRGTAQADEGTDAALGLPAIRDTVDLARSHVAVRRLGIALLGNWWALPCFLTWLTSSPAESR